MNLGTISHSVNSKRSMAMTSAIADIAFIREYISLHEAQLMEDERLTFYLKRIERLQKVIDIAKRTWVVV